MPREVLFHGTSSHRARSILREDRLRLPMFGDPKVSLTPSKAVAEYWARLSAQSDLSEGKGDGSGSIFHLHLGSLLRAGMLLTPFSDPVWGEGECDWEQEIACWMQIDGVLDHLVGFSKVVANALHPQP